MLYQHLAAANLNGDLGGLSAQVRSDSSRQDDGGTPIPETQSVFSFTQSHQAVASKPIVAALRVNRPPLPEQERTPVISRSKPVEIDPAFPVVVRAYGAYSNNDLTGAERLYREALDITPHNVDALSGLATVLAKTLRRTEAVGVYEKVLLIDPQNAIAIAAVLADATDRPTGEIESELKVLLQKHSGNEHLHFALGMHYAGNGNWPKANYEFLQAQQLNPANGDYNYNLAVSLERLGRSEEAARYYEHALVSTGTNVAFDREQTELHLRRLTASWGEF